MKSSLMDQKNMPQPLPPTRRITLKNKSLPAIILAVLLHILIAVIIYFSIFRHEQPTAVLPTTLDNPLVIPTAVIAENEKISPIEQNNLEAQNTTLPDSEKAADISTTLDTDLTAVNQSAKQDKNKTLAPTSKSTSKSTASKDTAKKTVSTSAAANSKASTVAAPTATSPTTSANQPEYKLKQTKETLQLDAEIDKDSEQLSKLIGEVKKRNQSQIQQHQLPKTNQRPVDNAPTVQYDYPITPISPITPLPANKNPESHEPVEP